jgi:hypothetical protein
VTDDLPTPPLPDATATTRWWRDHGVGRVGLGVEPGSAHGGRLLLGGELGPVEAHLRRRRASIDPGPGVALDLASQRAAGGGEGDGDAHLAVGADPHALGHAEVDDVAAELGVDHPAQDLHDVVLGRERGGLVVVGHAAILPGLAV